MQGSVSYKLGSFEIRPDQNLIVGPDGDLRIEPKAMAVLMQLVAAGGRTVPREEIISNVWPRGYVTDDALNGCISQLRRAFGDNAHEPDYIATVPKLGYRLVQDCVPAAEAPRDAVPRASWPGARHRRTGMAGVALALLFAAVVAWVGLRQVGSSTRHDAVDAHAEKSVAVLPFANLSNDERNAFFAHGMQDEILSNLARVSGLKVISRTSVMKYGSTSRRSMRDIARTLDVNYVIEGSVQRIGDKVRVTAQLIDARRDAHLWADHYDRKITDVFAIESDIAARIAEQLRARLTPTERAAMMQAPTSDLQAYELYDRARYVLVWNIANGADNGWRQRIRLLKQATRRDPQFALAWSAMARAYSELSAFADSPDDDLAKARQAIDTALRLQPDLEDAHRELARYYHAKGNSQRAYDMLVVMSQKWRNDPEIFRLMGRIDFEENRWNRALAHLRKAVALDPRNGEYTHYLQLVYRLTHRYDEGLRYVADAYSREPQYPAWRWLYLAQYKLDMGDPTGARKDLAKLPIGFVPTGAVMLARYRADLYLRDYAGARRVLAATPKKWAMYMYAGTPPDSMQDGVLARLQGKPDKARAIFARALASVPDRYADVARNKPQVLTESAQLHAELGQTRMAKSEAMQALQSLPAHSFMRQQLIIDQARVLTLSNQPELALQKLDSIAGKPYGPTYGDLRFNPAWDTLRALPGFQPLLARVKPAPGSSVSP